MNYEEGKIISDVLTAIDQNADPPQLVGLTDLDTLSVRQVVKSNVERSARWLLLNAQAGYIDNGEDMAGLPLTHDGSVYIVDLTGTDYLRLLFVQLKSWNRPAYTTVTEASPIYAMAQSRFTGITGHADRPIVADVHDGEGKHVLELYRGTDDDEIKRGQYVKAPHMIKGTLDFPEPLYDALVCHIGAQTCVTFQNNLAGTMFQRAYDYAGIALPQQQSK